jgi:hypothetical protein
MRFETVLELLQPAPADYRAFTRCPAVVLVYFLY